MIKEDFLVDLNKNLKRLLFFFTLTLSIGFYTGISFVHHTTSGTPSGINENYTGNEDVQDAEVMKFKKSKHEMLSLTHTHLLSMSVIFLILGIFVYGCRIPKYLKSFLIQEPMISVLLTFSSIYLVWMGYAWMTYITIISGTLMTISFSLSVLILFWQLLKN